MTTSAAVAVGVLARSSKEHLRVSAPHIERSHRTPVALGIVPSALSASSVHPQLLRKALEALERHSRLVKAHDRIAIVDFSAPSSEARMHLLDIVGGKASSIRVAHGMGSDPHHTGFLERFSNAVGSNASSEGAFLADEHYVGKHGRSQRLIGLDATNSNALERAVVVHGAWYADDAMIPAHGKLGRSQGCFAVGENRLADTFDFLGTGRLIYAGRV